MRTLVPVVGALTALSASCASPPASPPAATSHADEHGHGPLVHRFKGAEEWAKQFDDPARDAWQKPAEVVALLKLAPGMTVADVGAGTGYFEAALSRAVGPKGRVLALDIEDDMVAYLRARAAREGLANVAPAKVAPDDPMLPAGGVDRVLIVDTWHHIDAREAYAAKLRAALAPGGFVAVVDFTLEAQQGPPPQHRVAPEQVEKELRAGGLVPEIAVESLPDQYVVIGRAPSR